MSEDTICTGLLFIIYYHPDSKLGDIVLDEGTRAALGTVLNLVHIELILNVPFAQKAHQFFSDENK